ncbi:PfkB family carbohydrate kinase [Endomicrobium proavitum]|uniref:Kinase, PfkB family n=1 Tax=Endomicrobium proavitum TaxID=1408281 RepID=A0A0G3WJV7_9BACT|nr:PfkB family carbohydrate kinase [Endomicrobium proavitum]AKL98157.1 Kinase, PfkB family [Endomicrobium proavitum]
MKILALACFCVDVFPETGKILPGGNALNLAVNCKEAGAEVFAAGNIGTDKYADILKSAIDKYKIDRSRIYEIEGATANHTIHIDANGDRYFKDGAWISGVWADYKISESDKLFAKNMDAVATTFYEPDFENILSVKQQPLKQGSITQVEGDSIPLTAVDFHDAKISAVWEKYFNSIDLFFISGKTQDLKPLKEWSKKYKTVFTATLGEHGSISYKDGKEYKCGAVKVDKVIDTTGCGDSYIAGFIVEYLKSKNIEASMENGAHFASKTLSYIGGFQI